MRERALEGLDTDRVVDWSAARRGSRAVDLAWCRQDLVLLGSVEAAASLRRVYDAAARVETDDLAVWDIAAAAQAEEVVESWSPNWEGMGRPELTGRVMRARLDEWIARLLS